MGVIYPAFVSPAMYLAGLDAARACSVMPPGPQICLP
jgi:hypothetical protein